MHGTCPNCGTMNGTCPNCGFPWGNVQPGFQQAAIFQPQATPELLRQFGQWGSAPPSQDDSDLVGYDWLL